MSKLNPFKTWEKEYILTNYLLQTDSQIAEYLGCDRYKVKNSRYRNKLRKPEGYEDTGRFKKGSKPWNTGLKGLQTAGKETQFKKGNLPHNTKQDGTISVRKDKRGVPYQFIRISLGKWVHLHRHIWELHHGTIAEGMMIAFKNGNTLDCHIENLELITKSENVRRNQNPEKASKASKELRDKYLAGVMGRGSKELRKQLLKNPELLELKRTSLQLKRAIKNAADK